MLKLNAHKGNNINFNIDFNNMEEQPTGFFRIIHESIEYGFKAHILGNRNKATVEIPALNKLIPGLKDESLVEVKLEFVSGCDYVNPWSDTAQIVNPKVKNSITVESVTIEEEAAEIIVEKTNTMAKPKPKPRHSGYRLNLPIKGEEEEPAGPFAVSDEAFEEAAKGKKKDFIQKYQPPMKSKTTEEDGHWHKCEVDKKGNGKTTGTFRVAVKGGKRDPHEHKIVNGKTEGHSHSHSIVKD
jgi:hypothetical protein